MKCFAFEYFYLDDPFETDEENFDDAENFNYFLTKEDEEELNLLFN